MVTKRNFKESLESERDKKISILLKDLNSLESYVNDIFTFSPLPICFISPLGVILESNPVFVKFSGFSFNEVIGKAIEDFFEKREINPLIKETFEKGFVRGKEMRFFPKTKMEIPAQIFTRIRKDERGEKVGYFLSLVDLTEIKKTQRDARKALMSILQDVREERNKAEEEKNKTLAIITNFSDAIFVFDRDNNLLLVNPKAEHFFGIKGEEITGKSISGISRIVSIRPLVKLLTKKTKKIFRQELELREDLILETSLIPVMRETEKLGTLVILHDITREKLIEKMKSEFVSLTAHQLRTPLSAMKWTMKMLLDEELGKINEEQREFLENNYESNERMISLINDLLNVTRIEEGRFLYDLIPTDLEETIKSITDSYEEEAKRKKIKLVFKKPVKKIPEIMLDSDKIKMAIENLVDNAVRYTLSGGEVTISLKQVEKTVEFSIEDTGVGILKKQKARIFSKFFRGTNVMKMDTEGSGLGLYITKNIIDAHGGKIWFESELDKGAKFYFQLPIKPKGRAKPKKKA